MNKLHYTPGPTKVHRQGVIRQLCRPFLSHENGLPEWVKNSAAAYSASWMPGSPETVSPSSGMTTALNRSKRAMVNVIQRLIDEFHGAQVMAREAEISFASIVNDE